MTKKYPTLPPQDYLAKWDERITVLQKRVADLLYALHRIKGHCQSRDAEDDIDAAQSEFREIFNIATEAIKTDGENK